MTLSLPLVALEPPIENLKELQWKHRVILVKPGSDLTNWMDQLNAVKSEIVDRDIIWFLFDGESHKTNSTIAISDQLETSILERYFQNKNTRLVLIGKDGGVKDASSELNLSELFALIDGMPMRRAEMREESN